MLSVFNVKFATQKVLKRYIFVFLTETEHAQAYKGQLSPQVVVSLTRSPVL